MPRAYTREPTRPDVESEQTHDECEWLNEEDGEEDVLRNWRDGIGAASATRRSAREQGRDGQDNARAEDRRGDGGDERGA